MGYQTAYATGSGNTLSVGPLIPNQNNMLGILLANAGLVFNPGGGWTNITGSDFYWQQFSTQSPITVTAPISAHPDNTFYSENWATTLLLFPTSSPASFLNAETPITLVATTPPSGPATSSPFSVVKGQTIVVWASNGSSGDEGQDGADFGLSSVIDSSGNAYTSTRVVVSANDQGQGVFTYAVYIWVAIANATNPSLVITTQCEASSHGFLDGEAYIGNNIINPAGYCQGDLLLW
jgi:hypothetical protein